MKVKTGDKYKLDGCCQYGYTRCGKRVAINPFNTVTKIKDNLLDILTLKSMYILDGTDLEININDSIIERYFIKIK